MKTVTQNQKIMMNDLPDVFLLEYLESDGKSCSTSVKQLHLDS